MPQPAPQMLHYNRNKGMGKVVLGFSIFSVSYLVAALAGTSMIDAGEERLGKPLVVPVVGPFIAATRAPYATLGFGIALGGVVQVLGLGLGITGAVQLSKARRNAPTLSAAPGGLQIKF